MLLVFPAVAFAADGGEGETLAGASGADELAPLLHPEARLTGIIDSAKERLRRERIAAERREAREAREAYEDLPGGVTIETLTAIGECESGGDPTAVSADGSFRGKYQFMVSTWESVGGSGDPAAAPEIEQDYRAALLYARSGSSPWPVCG